MAYKFYVELKRYKEEILGLDLSNIVAQGSQLFSSYQKSPDQSFKARSDYYTQLHLAISNYYNTQIYAKKTFWQKVASFFGWFLPEDEKKLVELKKNVNAAREESVRVYEDNWHLPWFIRIFARSGPESYTGKAFDLRVAAHRLMGKERFDNKKLEILPPGLAAYRLQQDLKLFASSYDGAFSAKQRALFNQAFLLLSNDLVVQGAIEKSREILNVMKSDAAHDARLADITYEYKHKLLQLKPHEKLLLPHGFSSKKGSHGALVEFTRNADGRTFTLSSIDTAVLATDRGVLDDGWSRLCMVNDITMDEISADLIENLVFSPHHTAETLEEGKARIAAPFAKFDKEGRLKLSDKKYARQANSTCSHDCLWEWLRLSIGETLFVCVKDFIFTSDLATLDVLSGKFDVDLQKDIERLKVVGSEQKEEAERAIAQEYKSVTEQVSSSYEKIMAVSKKKISKKEKINSEEKIEAYMKKREEKEQAVKEQYQDLMKKPRTEKPAAPAIFFSSLFSSKKENDLWEKYQRNAKKLEYVKSIFAVRKENKLTIQYYLQNLKK